MVLIRKKLLKNDQIKAKQVRVTGAEGEALGVMLTSAAIQKAQELNVDLICIAQNANPPVCKLIEEGKHEYEQKKREKELKKKQTQTVIKEARFKARIDDHDYETKKNQIISFLEKGNKVKCSMRFRGREITHSEIGRKLFERLQSDIETVGQIETKPKLEGNQLMMILAPMVKSNG